MGNGIGKITVCFTGGGEAARRVGNKGIGEISLYMADPLDEGLGHSFCYVRPDPTRISSSKVHSEETTTKTKTFKTISGASVSANTSTPLSTALTDLYSYNSVDRAAAFESSTSFASIPLQPIPRSFFAASGPISGGGGASGPMERGFMSGPIERGFMSGPLDQRTTTGVFSGPIDRSFSHGGAFLYRRRSKKERLIGVLKRVITKTIARGQNSIVAPIKGFGKESEWGFAAAEKGNSLNLNHNENLTVSSLNNLSSEESLYDDESTESQSLQWAQGKAGEDRVHVVVSEEHGWVFVGIYDGFNGPDAPDYLLSNLYSAVHKELKGLLWDEKPESAPEQEQEEQDRDKEGDCACAADHHHAEPDSEDKSRRRWRCEWDREKVETAAEATDHAGVVSALSRALKMTEEAFLDEADRLAQNPELALMGSCVLVMLMKGEDVYLMNVGDSRAVLGRKPNPNLLHRINEDDLDSDSPLSPFPTLSALQLTRDHSTCVQEEVQRIRDEHPDDSCAMVNDRVKGSLKVTRAFGAGFLKQPKWNDALLEMFRIDYVGTLPYLSCEPYVHHHRLGIKDQFLILSSDGLYQYFTNQEAVTEVELFIALQPDGDPAQHLVEEVLFRAAKKAGMDFHELLEIPQGDRRRYHDDVSIIVISLEGRIWRSCV